MSNHRSRRPVTEEDHVVELKTKHQTLQELMDQDTSRLDFLFDEIHKLTYPLQVFSSLRKLWIRVEHEPFFTHDIDDKLDFMEMHISYLDIQQKRASFSQTAQQLLELQNRVVTALSAVTDVDNLDRLEVEQVKLLLRKLENEEREYLQYDVSNVDEEFKEEKLFEKMVELVQRMESMMAVTTQKLRSVIVLPYSS
ncbi:unnamed protein product [Orchesella dallaii]|uniref:Uncharacterized protein n=1 Tax=Orchesella dallaii TaxID=48710 RepID=A0ABP1RPH6_9HEXA